jgi:hypothetical protein
LDKDLDIYTYYTTFTEGDGEEKAVSASPGTRKGPFPYAAE